MELGFVNGTKVTYMDFAKLPIPFTGITSGESLGAIVLYSLRHCNQPKCRYFQYNTDNIFSRSQYSSSRVPITGCPSDK